MSGFLLDSNILLDIATSDPTWMAWSERQLRIAAAQGSVFINPIIYAEIAPAFATATELDRWLDADVFTRRPLLYAAAWLAAQASRIVARVAPRARRYRIFLSEPMPWRKA
jgi:predicted nucleic acid-binding protein